MYSEPSERFRPATQVVEMMARKKIGIKYCGGCNPRFERLDMVKRVQSALKGLFLFLPYGEERLDLLLLINGCPKACASEVLTGRDTPHWSITQESDFESLMGWLKAGAPNIPMKATAEIIENNRKE